MRCVILQPSYIPWRGYFHQALRADIFVFYDDVQFDKHGWRNRNRIRTPEGTQWLTIPVRTRGCFGQSIRDVRIDDAHPWRRKHLAAVRQHYGRAAYAGRVLPWFQEALEAPGDGLADLCMGLTVRIARELGAHARFLRSSDLGVRHPDRTMRVVEICRAVGADEYLVGPSARAYQAEDAFARAGIALEYQTYDYPPYPQQYPGYEPQVSVLDLLMNCGSRSAERIWGAADAFASRAVPGAVA